MSQKQIEDKFGVAGRLPKEEFKSLKKRGRENVSALSEDCANEKKAANLKFSNQVRLAREALNEVRERKESITET